MKKVILLVALLFSFAAMAEDRAICEIQFKSEQLNHRHILDLQKSVQSYLAGKKFKVWQKPSIQYVGREDSATEAGGWVAIITYWDCE